MSETSERPRLGAHGHRAGRAVSRAARSRPGSRRPGAPGRDRPRPSDSSPSADERDAEVARRGLVPRDRLARDLGEVDRLAPDRELVPVHPREVEQVAHEPLEPPRLEQDRPRCLVGAERPLAEPLGVAADRGQRRLQLVADREQEVPLALARGGELLGHLVEGLRERGELARRPSRAAASASRRRRARGSPRRPAAPAGRSSARRRTRGRAASAAPASAGEQQVAEERMPRGGARRSPAAAAAARAPGIVR